MLTIGGSRAGASLIELLVTTVVGGIALTLVTVICLREQRVFTDMETQSAAYAQLRDAEAILPIDVRAASSVGGDIREARDTSLELRAVIASAVICDTAGASIILAPPVPGADAYASPLSAVAPGDTAWVLIARDSASAWRPFRVASSALFRPGPCTSPGPRLGAAVRTVPRSVFALDSAVPASLLGAPLRVTRPMRYSLYRGTDGRWYLGQRDWNTATLRFNAIQPVSGPFLSAAAGGVVFHYVDSVGAPLATPVTNTRLIAAVRVDLRGDAQLPTRALSSASQRGPRVDSATLWILLRNRR